MDQFQTNLVKEIFRQYCTVGSDEFQNNIKIYLKKNWLQGYFMDKHFNIFIKIDDQWYEIMMQHWTDNNSCYLKKRFQTGEQKFI